jgi:glycerol-3-phosphate cytidylyltransferase-like family protein
MANAGYDALYGNLHRIPLVHVCFSILHCGFFFFIKSSLDSGLDQPLLHAVLLVLHLPTENWRWYLKQGGEVKQNIREKVVSLTSNNSLVIGVHLQHFEKKREKVKTGMRSTSRNEMIKIIRS